MLKILVVDKISQQPVTSTNATAAKSSDGKYKELSENLTLYLIICVSVSFAIIAVLSYYACFKSDAKSVECENDKTTLNIDDMTSKKS